MVSPTDLANMGLGLLSDTRIEDINAVPKTTREDLVHRFFTPALEAVLALAAWKFATGWIALVPMAETPPGPWARMYALPQPPNIHLRPLVVHQMSEPDEWVRGYDPVSNQDVVYTGAFANPFAVNGAATGASEPLAAFVTFSQLNTARWTPLAIQGAAYKLAGDMSFGITAQAQKHQLIMADFQTWIQQATAKDSKEAFQTAQVQGGATAARLRGVGRYRYSIGRGVRG